MVKDSSIGKQTNKQTCDSQGESTSIAIVNISPKNQQTLSKEKQRSFPRVSNEERENIDGQVNINLNDIGALQRKTKNTPAHLRAIEMRK